MPHVGDAILIQGMRLINIAEWFCGCSGIAGYLFSKSSISEIEDLGHDALMFLGVRPLVHDGDSA